MPIDAVTIIGAGGHAKVVIDAVRAAEPGWKILVLDSDPGKAGQMISGIEIAAWAGWNSLGTYIHIAIGDNTRRSKIHGEALAHGRKPVSVIHPSAQIASSAELGEGTFAAAGCVVAADARVGEGAVINHNAVVDHDVNVGDFSHIAPGAVIGGAVVLGQRVLVGANATILPLCTIGEAAVIAAGAVVTRNVAPGLTMTGVPARERPLARH